MDNSTKRRPPSADEDEDIAKPATKRQRTVEPDDELDAPGPGASAQTTPVNLRGPFEDGVVASSGVDTSESDADTAILSEVLSSAGGDSINHSDRSSNRDTGGALGETAPGTE